MFTSKRTELFRKKSWRIRIALSATALFIGRVATLALPFAVRRAFEVRTMSAAAVIGLIAVDFTATMGGSTLAAATGESYVQWLRRRILRRILAAPLDSFSHERLGSLTHALTNDSDAMRLRASYTVLRAAMECSLLAREVGACRASGRRITELLRTPLTPPGYRCPPGDAVDLELDDVSFAYDDGKCVFGSLSLRIPPGLKVRVAGPSGAGKTTLFLLAGGLLKP